MARSHLPTSSQTIIAEAIKLEEKNKNLTKRNKELEEENEKLKQEVRRLKNKFNTLRILNEELCYISNELQELPKHKDRLAAQLTNTISQVTLGSVTDISVFRSSVPSSSLNSELSGLLSSISSIQSKPT